MPDLPDLPKLPPGLLAELRADPDYALEALAKAAVDVHGPAAEKWVRSKDALAYSEAQLGKSAVQRHANMARIEGAALGLGGFITIAPNLAALLWILTREVLFVAAAHGQDPTDPRRAAEMLVILEVYDSVTDAQAALDRQGERLPIALARSQVTSRLGGGNRSMSSKLARWGGKKLVTKYSGRLVPGLGALLGAIDNSASAKRVGKAATTFYTGR